MCLFFEATSQVNGYFNRIVKYNGNGSCITIVVVYEELK